MTQLKNYNGHYLDPNYLNTSNIVLIDGGACIGKFVDAVLTELKIKTIFCLEPGAQNFQDLLEKYKDRNDVICINEALVGEGSPKESIYYDYRLPTARYQEWGGIKGLYLDKRQLISKYPVKTTTLSVLLKKYSIDFIDYLKMDVEGCESEIIATLTEYTASKIGQLSMEVHNNDAESLIINLQKFGFTTILKPGELYAINENRFK